MVQQIPIVDTVDPVVQWESTYKKLSGETLTYEYPILNEIFVSDTSG